MEQAKELKTLYVGQQPVRHYVILANTFLKAEEQIKVVGRGKWIAKVVTIAEILKRGGAKLGEIKTDSVQMRNSEGQNQFVSVLSVTVAR